jgi:thioredoxin 1
VDSILLWLLIGAAVGAGAGYFRKAGSRQGWLISGWKRGALSGSIVALVFYTASGDGIGLTMNRSTANVKHIGDNEFDSEVAEASLPVVVDCYATWCVPCRELAPTIDNLAKEYAGKIKFVKVNVDESPGLSQKFQIEVLPTLLFFKAGQLTDTSIGLISKPDLARQLGVLLQTNPPAALPRPKISALPLLLPGFY